MRCPHCRVTIPRHRRGPNGGQCGGCRRLFVVDRRVACTAFSPDFLRRRVAALGRDGAFRVTSLQLLRDVARRRPYPPQPPPPLWDLRRVDFEHPPGVLVVVAIGLSVAGGGFAVVRWHDAVPTEVLVVALLAILTCAVPILVVLGFAVDVLFRVVPLFVVRLLGRSVTALLPDRRKAVLTPSAFTADARTVAADLVDEDGSAPPPAPEPVRFAVLCPDPGVAACLWANGVGERLGGLVVTAREDLPRRVPILDLSDATPGDSPADLVTTVLRFARRHLDAGRTGFLTWPVSR